MLRGHLGAPCSGLLSSHFTVTVNQRGKLLLTNFISSHYQNASQKRVCGYQAFISSHLISSHPILSNPTVMVFLFLPKTVPDPAPEREPFQSLSDMPKRERKKKKKKKKKGPGMPRPCMRERLSHALPRANERKWGKKGKTKIKEKSWANNGRGVCRVRPDECNKNDKKVDNKKGVLRSCSR